MPITRQATNPEWHKILTMARNNGFPEHIIHELKKNLTTNKTKVTQTNPPQKQCNKWITFIFHGPPVHKVTNLFRKTDLKIAFCPTNRIFQQLTQKPKNNNPSGIYQLKCKSCNRAYVGQSGRAISLRHEHLRYIRNNNPISAYGMHILHNRHQFRPADETLKHLKPCNKGTKMNCWEALYRVSQEDRTKLRESVPYVKLYRYNPKHIYPKLNGYGDNGQRKLWTSCISAYCTSTAVWLIDLCGTHFCDCTSSPHCDMIAFHYCRYVQCLVTLRTTVT